MINLSNILLEYSKKGLELINPIEVKSGKDASVFCVNSAQGLLALKVYHDEKLHSVNYYFEYANQKVLPPSIQRAIKSGNKIGKQTLQMMRIDQEFRMLKKFYAANVFIPKPIATASNTVLMEYLGELNNPALRLVDVELTLPQAEDALDEILWSMEQMLALNFVHGDLSAYNILYWNGKPYIIDFPQVINIREHAEPFKVFRRDLHNVCDYFKKYMEINVDDLISDFKRYFKYIDEK
ncbi:MAG: hypothetical protein OHK0017_12200 [Patescibacteria group bacterium]